MKVPKKIISMLLGKMDLFKQDFVSDLEDVFPKQNQKNTLKKSPNNRGAALVLVAYGVQNFSKYAADAVDIAYNEGFKDGYRSGKKTTLKAVND